MQKGKQILAALCVIVIVVGGGACLLAFLAPSETVEIHGYRFRGKALLQEQKKPLVYAPERSCLASDCHGEKAPEQRAVELSGGHKAIACQACHGPALEHVRSKGKEKAPAMPTEAEPLTNLCMLCHALRAGLPKGFKTISDFETHRDDMGGQDEETCVDCHDPHTCEVD